MPPGGFLGEFEQMLLLAILQCRDRANGYEIRKELEASADRTVSKGAFYTTLDRMEAKGLVTWVSRPGSGRSTLPQRHFHVTPDGLEELRRSRAALLNLWRDLDEFAESS